MLIDLQKLPAFPCGWPEPSIVRSAHQPPEVHWIDVRMSPDEVRGIARRFLELADAAEL